jgi:hypothetical protein
VSNLAIEKASRVGPQGDNPRPIKARVRNQDDKRQMLSQAKVLPNTPTFAETKIAPDLTPTQQRERRVLVGEGEKDLVIRGNLIVKKTQKKPTIPHTNQAALPELTPEGAVGGPTEPDTHCTSEEGSLASEINPGFQ